MTKSELIDIIQSALADYENDNGQIVDCAICLSTGELFMWDGEQMSGSFVEEIDGINVDDIDDGPKTLLN